MRLPKPLPENVGKWSSHHIWLNMLREAVASIMLVPGEGTQITRTSKGTTVSAKPGGPFESKGEESPGAVVRWG
jgi:hypothetical protein